MVVRLCQRWTLLSKGLQERIGMMGMLEDHGLELVLIVQSQMGFGISRLEIGNFGQDLIQTSGHPRNLLQIPLFVKNYII